MKFNYQAKTKDGEVQTGVVEAPSPETAIALLQEHNLFVISLESAETLFYFLEKLNIFKGGSRKEVVLFSRQLSIMFKSNVSLVESLKVLSEQLKNPRFKEVVLKLANEVEGGTPFSKALSFYPEIFSPFYVNMVKSGEISGNLSESLNYLADHLEREYHLFSKTKGAMVYPALVVVVLFAVFMVLCLFVIPQLITVFKETEMELPMITKIVIALSHFLRKWIFLLIGIVVALSVISSQYLQTPKGKKNFDSIILKVPLVGSFLKMLYLSRFAENFSTLISGGLSMTQALKTSGEVVGNETYKEIIFLAKEEAKKGKPISATFSKFPDIFPPIFTQMTLVGEKTGTLDDSLMNLVNFYQKEIDRGIDNLLSILEPLLILFLGGSVAILMASILMPIYQISGF